jgi:glycosyltransferase involved in cell wall biosynthesis
MGLHKRLMIFGSHARSLVNFRGPLIFSLAKCGYEIVAVAPDIDKETADALNQLGAKSREIPLQNVSINPLALLRSLRATRMLVRQERPDVLLAYTITPIIVAALVGHAERVSKVISLITGAGYAFTSGREPTRLISRAAASLLYRLALKRSHVIVFQNPDDEALFRRLHLVSRDQTTHIVNGSGVDLDHFYLAPLPKRTAFLMIARLLKDKGIREFADAAKRLKVKHPEIPILLVGDLDPSPDSLSREELDELVRSGIDYKGYLTDVRPMIATASVYVLPSYREGTPRSVLEAMAMGRAIITTDAPGCRETVRNEENGLLVPPRNADSLYQAMLRFVDEPGLAAAMGPASRKLAEEKYDVHQVNANLFRAAGLYC